MTLRQRLLGLGLMLAAVAAAHVASEAYFWMVHGSERAELAELRKQAAEFGVAVIRTHARADTVERALQRADAGVNRQRHFVEAAERWAENGTLSTQRHALHGERVASYNARVRMRNELARDWRESRRANRQAVERYNDTLTRIRTLATAMGDPYFPVPSPAEAALERGLFPVEQ